MDYLYVLLLLSRVFHLPVRNLVDQLRRQSTIDRSLYETPFARADVSGRDGKVLVQVARRVPLIYRITLLITVIAFYCWLDDSTVVMLYG